MQSTSASSHSSSSLHAVFLCLIWTSRWITIVGVKPQERRRKALGQLAPAMSRVSIRLAREGARISPAQATLK